MSAPTADHATAQDEEGREEDLGFGRAVLIGSGIGIVVMIVALFAILRVIAPDIPAGMDAAIAVWTGAWTGLFLGGTVTVGRWSGQRH
jgi:hypothetical protein